MNANLTAVEDRACDLSFTLSCSLNGLRERLPLRWPTPPDTPPSPKKKYRSQYVYLGWDDLNDPATWEHLTPFDVVLRLVDFSGVRPVLAHLLGWDSARGQVPFDPVSIFLLLGWQLVHRWNRATLLTNLADPRYADYAHRFGFQHDRPTEGGLRYYLTTLGVQSETDGELAPLPAASPAILVQALNQLIIQSVTLLHQAGLLSSEAWAHALVCPDGMLHLAASHMRCASVTATCYAPTSPQQPRPCPAKAKGRQGCACDSRACAQMCQYAPSREAQARFVWYAGSNQPGPNPNQLVDPSAEHTRGKGVFGYRSLPLQLADAQRRFSIILLDDVRPANEDEEYPVAALLTQLPTAYPCLHVDTVAGDASFGRESVLSTVYHCLHARRVIDLRRHDTDRDKTQWPLRGYDDKGRPICPFGYRFTANGFDAERQRHKWLCAHICLNGVEPLVVVPAVNYPPTECPYLSPDHPNGRVLNIAECFPDGSTRLVRDVPVGSPTWKELYHRARNAVEGRNAAFEDWDLKRMPVYGLPRVKAFIFLADVWCNLTTLARLVIEATAADRVT